MKDISPEGTTALLGTVATSVLTLAGVTFSGTLVALTLASSQFGPRLLRNFTRARTTQFTLGILLATHAYALIVLRNVRVGDYSFVPHIATLGAFILTLLSLTMFIVFIHYVITSIQAERVVADVREELDCSIERFFGLEFYSGQGEETERRREKEQWDDVGSCRCLPSEKSGYLQGVDIDDLVKLAQEHDARCRVLVKPGQYIVHGQPLLAWQECEVSEENEGQFLGPFLLGMNRTAEQDFEYCIRQLVEVALRALSPGINDPFTAMNCIDHLSGAMVQVARKRLPQHEFTDSEDVPRVRTPPSTFGGFLGSAFNQIRQAAVDKPDVSMSLLESLYQVGKQCRTDDQIKAVIEQATLTTKVAKQHAETDMDQQAIEERFEEFASLTSEAT